MISSGPSSSSSVLWFFTFFDCNFFSRIISDSSGSRPEISMSIAFLSFGFKDKSFDVFYLSVEGSDLLHAEWDVTLFNMRNTFNVNI